MDLRRSVLLKQRALGDVSLNVSNISSYDSAMEDTETSVYYSFVDDSMKSMDGSITNDIMSSSAYSEDKENNSMSTDDKENTVIMRQTDEPMCTEDLANNQSANLEKSNNNHLNEGIVFHEIVAVKVQKPADSIDAHIDDIEDAQISDREAEKLEKFLNTDDGEQVRNSLDDKNILQMLAGTAGEHVEALKQMEQDLPLSDIQILVQDPNENIINPFTAIPEIPRLSSTDIMPERSSAPTVSSEPIAEKRVTRLSVSGKTIPTMTNLYSPLRRKSLDRKSKVPLKPHLPRRTIYEAGPSKLNDRPRRTICNVTTQVAQSSSGKAKTPTLIPKLATKAKTHKCSFAGCVIQLASAKLLQEHLKIHKVTSAVQSTTFVCKWCDKKFQVETALQNHQTEKCTKIPFHERRKVLGQREKKEIDRRRTTLFTLPMPKRKSPMRTKKAPNASLNKSGIKVTPKKSLKCHICGLIVPDAFTFANHFVTHKINQENATA